MDEDVGGLDIIVAVALFVEVVKVLENSVERAAIDPIDLFWRSGLLMDSFG